MLVDSRMICINPFPALIGKIYATDRASCVPITVDFTVLRNSYFQLGWPTIVQTVQVKQL